MQTNTINKISILFSVVAIAFSILSIELTNRTRKNQLELEANTNQLSDYELVYGKKLRKY